jgi:hypothetical protein
VGLTAGVYHKPEIVGQFIVRSCFPKDIVLVFFFRNHLQVNAENTATVQKLKFGLYGTNVVIFRYLQASTSYY